MPRRATKGNNRVEFSARPDEKAILARAVVERAKRVALSGRDSLKVADPLKSPPKPNARLKRAARASPKRP